MISLSRIFKIRIVLSVLIFAAGALISGCSEDPSSVGSGILPDKISIKEYNSAIDAPVAQSANFSKVLSLNNAGIFLVGRSEGVNATSLIRFDFSIFPYKTDLLNDSLTILSAQVRLTPFYNFGDTASVLPLEVYKVYTNWSSGTITADSAGELVAPRVDRIVSGSREFFDSLYKFKISTDLVKEWLMAASSDTLGYIDNGIMLSSAANASKIVGFRSFSGDPNIIPSIELILQKPGSYTDTVVYNLLEDIHFVEGAAPSIPAGRLFTRSGMVDFTSLSFDISSVPVTASINKATLTLHIDSLSSRWGDEYNDALVAFFMSDSASKTYESVTSGRLNRSGWTYTGEVTSIITRMRFQKNNQGFAISPGSQVEGVERFVFYPPTHPDTTLRPVLKIYYSEAE